MEYNKQTLHKRAAEYYMTHQESPSLDDLKSAFWQYLLARDFERAQAILDTMEQRKDDLPPLLLEKLIEQFNQAQST